MFGFAATKWSFGVKNWGLVDQLDQWVIRIDWDTVLNSFFFVSI